MSYNRRVKCFHCKKTIDVSGKVARGDACPHCSSDVRVCLNCRFYGPASYNECREPQAERVVNKDKANFCEFFEAGVGGGGEEKGDEDPLKKLKNIFGDS